MSNKSARNQLELLYGTKCFITGEMDNRTYHHLVKKCYGGEASVENGAVLNRDFHSWLHNLENEDPTLFGLLNECMDLAKQAIDIQDNNLVNEWEYVKMKIRRQYHE